MANYYESLITRVIKSFDEIYTVLNTKGAEKVNGGELTATGTTGVAVEEYANIIDKYLFRVVGLAAEDIKTTTIANKTGAVADSGNAVSVNYTNKSITLSGLTPGYYDATSTITKTDANMFLNATAGNFTKVTDSDGKITGYEITPTNKIISKVTLDAAAVDGSITISEGEGQTDKLTLGVSHSLSAGKIAIKETGEAGDYKFEISCTPSITGKLLASVTTSSITEGLLKSSAVKINGGELDINLKGSAVPDDFYIAKSNHSITAVTGGTTLSAEGLARGTSTADGYLISAKATKPTISHNITAGYTEGETGNVSYEDTLWSTEPENIYIKKGSVDLPEGLTNSLTIVNNIGSLADAADSKKVSISVTANAHKFDMTTTEGYVNATDVDEVNIAAATKYINIDKASGAVSTSNTEITATSSYLSATDTGISFTVNAKPVVTRSATAGYLSDESEITVDNTKTYNQTFYINAGSVGEIKNTLTAVARNHDDNPDIAMPEVKDMFLSTEPTSKDYYEIEATASATSTTGYITGTTITGASNKYYIPKAELKYIDSEDGSFIQITKGGFLPSGVITSIANIQGTIDTAVVNVNATSKDGLVINSAEATAYEIVFGKGTINAGYISQTDGSVAGSIKIAHATATSAASINTITNEGITAVKADGKTTGYTVALKATGTVKTNVTEGYIKATDLKVNNETGKNNTDVTYTKESTITLNKASVSLAASAVSGSVATSKGLELSDTATGYTITPTIGSDGAAALQIKVDTAGYLGTEETFGASVSLGNAETKYIKAGTQLKSVNGTGSVALTDNFATQTSGDYTVQVSATQNTVAVKGTLESGYYGSATERAVSGVATVTGSTTVARGHVDVTGASASLGISNSDDENGSVLIETEVSNASAYYAIKPTASGLTVSANVTKQGYVKAADLSNTAQNLVNSNGTKNFYIGKYSSAKYLDSTNQVITASTEKADAYIGLENFGINSEGANVDYAIINTQDKYTERNIAVTLHEDAAGSAVRSALSSLEQRLNGNNVALGALLI